MKTLEAVRTSLRKREWQNAGNLRARLLGERAFPIELPLDPPTGADVANAPGDTRAFIAQWREAELGDAIAWEERRPRGVATIEVPVRLRLRNIFELARFLGEDARQWIAEAGERLDAMAAVDRDLVRPAVFDIQAVVDLVQEDFKGLCRVLPQLREGMGGGLPLRSLALEGVDTKFVETHQALIERLLDRWRGGEVTAAGGLEAWLHVVASTGEGMLLVRPLCDEITDWFRGMRALRVGWRDLERLNPPCTRLLVVENAASVFALPAVPGGLAVGGTGGNLKWLDAAWVQAVPVAYWGDLDTDGFRLLAQARMRVPHLQSLLMDRETLESARHRGVVEPTTKRERTPVPMELLSEEEGAALVGLSMDEGRGRIRLEQERIDGPEVHERVHKQNGWGAGYGPPPPKVIRPSQA